MAQVDINEDWIKTRVKLDQDNLDDVKSLTLPGTYHEKINCLGFSLQNFTRLQHLDLSKNSIVSLKGLEHLSLLESLNLYYNKIQDLKEVFRLRKNQNLRDMDLRLNPVTGNEPDYRLFIAHMLPLLRRLDDRPLRDSERKAALLHFSSSEPSATTNGQAVANSENTKAEKSKQPRVNHAKNNVLPSVIPNDSGRHDAIDYVDKQNAPVAQQNGKPEAKIHGKQDLLKIVRKENEEIRKKLEINGGTNIRHNTAEANLDKNHLDFTDEESAYSQFKSVANFTPHPGHHITAKKQDSCGSSGISTLSTEDGSENDERNPHQQDILNYPVSAAQQELTRCRNAVQNRLLESMLDLVDRYWNGSRSLHHNKKFQALVLNPISVYEKEMLSAREVQIKVLHDKIQTQQHELESVHNHLHQAKKDNMVTKNTKEVEILRKELINMKNRLQTTLDENKKLRSKLGDLEKTHEELLQKPVVDNTKEMGALENEKKELMKQVAALNETIEQYQQSQQITQMLKDSHRSLVSTNEHLLAELDIAKSRHQTEIDQLKWSYDQLRAATKLSNGHNNHDIDTSAEF